jgi:basic amino acid/polyamine antiporter, APA family
VLWPAASAGLGRAVVLTALLGGFALANAAGIRQGALLVNVLTVAKLVSPLFFVGVGLFFVDAGRQQILTILDLPGLREASLLLVFAFGGFENASVPAEEVGQPRRNVPIALLIAIRSRPGIDPNVDGVGPLRQHGDRERAQDEHSNRSALESVS